MTYRNTITDVISVKHINITGMGKRIKTVDETESLHQRKVKEEPQARAERCHTPSVPEPAWYTC